MTTKTEMENVEIKLITKADMEKAWELDALTPEDGSSLDEYILATHVDRGINETWGTTMVGSGRAAARRLITSQKALGVVYACERAGTSAYGARIAHAMWMTLDISDREILSMIITKVHNYSCWDFFIRSCPDTPRPGVLDSFQLNLGAGDNLAPIMELRDNMRELDPNGCILLMDHYPATHCATLSTAGHITAGHGKDGVTAGNNGRTWSMEMDTSMVGGPEQQHKTYLEYIESYGMNKGDAEIEYVSVQNQINGENPDGRSIRTHFVQYRAAETGPLMTEWAYFGDEVLEKRTDDAFPAMWPDDMKQITPTSCLVMHTLADVTELESLIEQGGWPKDFVVFAPTMSTASHAACTARAAGIPYFKTQPNLNKTISQCGEKWDSKPYWGDFLSGVTIGYKHSSILIHGGTYTHGEWLSIPFHQFVTMPPNDAKETAICAGAFVGWLLKAATAVAVGETRHKHKKMEWNDRILLSTFTEVSNTDVSHRGAYYRSIDKEVPNQQTLEDILNWCVHIFEDYQWNNSYGGEAYAITMRKALKVLKHLQTFQHHATKANFNKLITAVGGTNGLENAVHNCGHFFNKFALKEAFDAGTAGLELSSIGRGHHALLLTAIEQVLDKEHGEAERNVRFTQAAEGIKNKKAPSTAPSKIHMETTVGPWDQETHYHEITLDGKVIQKNLKQPVTQAVTLTPSPYPTKETKTIETGYKVPWSVGDKLSTGDQVKWVMPKDVLDLVILGIEDIEEFEKAHSMGSCFHHPAPWMDNSKVYKVEQLHRSTDAHTFSYVRTECGERLSLLGCEITHINTPPPQHPVAEWWDSLTPETQKAIPLSKWLLGYMEDK